MMQDFSVIRGMSHILVGLTVRLVAGGTRPIDGKIKAAGCGAVGWRKSAGTSGTSPNVQQDATICGFAQVPENSTLRAPCVHRRHDPRR
jgi:hypothetical protein